MKKLVLVFLLPLLPLISLARDKITVTVLGDKVKEYDSGNCHVIECTPSTNVCYKYTIEPCLPTSAIIIGKPVMIEILTNNSMIKAELVSHNVVESENGVQVHKIQLK
jgi:hypothetical protein